MGASPRGFESLRFRQKNADVAQVVEHILGKDEVTSSSLVISSKIRERNSRIFLYLRIEDIKCTILYIVRSCSSSALGFCKYFVLASAYACRHQKNRIGNSRIFLYLRIEDIKCTILYIVRSCSSSALGFCKYFVLASAYACRHQKNRIGNSRIFFISSHRRYKMHDFIYRAELLVVCAWLLQTLRACLRLRLPSSEKADRKFTILFFVLKI